MSLVGTNGLSGQIAFACDVNVSILKPNNAGTLVSPTCMEGSGFIDSVRLPTSGQYTIVIDPTSLATGSLTLALYTITTATGSVVVNGGALPLTTSAPGQNIDVTFVGAVNQSVRGSTTTPSSSTCATLTIVRQDGTTVVSSYSACGSTITMPSTTLPAGETYHLIVDPSSTTTGAFSVSVGSP